jgi:D-alanyl-D-alanine carboxypeptidase/D-alanyl-D-alanine-endopeptidase (penicillin-binding protein 4)
MISENQNLNKHLINGLLSIFILFLLSSNALAQKLTKRKVAKVFKSSEILKNHYTGFSIYDLKTMKPVFEIEANKPAIPASNTKLFTLYTALSMLGDSIPGLRYISKGDSLIFWGTGDPAFLHPDLKSKRVYDFLKNSGKKLFYSHNNAGTDFNGSAIYQIAMVSLPVGENRAQAYADKYGNLEIKPAFLKQYLKLDTSFHPRTFTILRDDKSNTFTYPQMAIPANYRQTLYLVPGAELTAATLSDTLKLPVNIIRMNLPPYAKTIYSIPSDSLYRRMMLPSDNYLAEQILYLCSSLLPGKLSVDSAISYSSKNFLNDLPDKFQWRDGSGLSRYNLFSPRSIIKILTKIKEKLGTEERLHNLLPAGGVSGTLRNAYKTDNGQPFVWAKTGTLQNVHLQGGFFVTRKGKKYMYSFMNNNFMIPTSEIRDEMGRIITLFHENY